MKGLGRATETVVRALADDILATLDGIPDEDLGTWKPAAATDEDGGEMNTFAAIAIHTALAGRWMVNHQVFGEEVTRDRESEFHAAASRSEIEALYAAWMEDLSARLATLERIDLDAPPLTPRANRPGWTRGDYLLHMIEHTGLHLGHLQIQRQLWQAERQK
jgi:hypothetical protein